jgi:aminoglycoside phosphotransferase (APT) family kinase protein
VAGLTAQDLSALAPRLGAAWGGEPVEMVAAWPLSSGASRLSWALDVRAGSVLRRLVVQRERDRGLGRNDVRHEVAVLAAASARGVPAPTVVLADPVGDAIGGAFVVTERIEGESIPRRIARDPEYEGVRSTFARRCGEILAAIHAIPLSDVPGLPAFDPVAAVEAMLDGVDDPRPVFESALRWLRAHPPPPNPPAVVHGDFRNGNLIVGPDGIRAVLDWELTHVGDPLEDVGWLCSRPWRWGGDRAVGGLGDRIDLLRAYRAAGGLPVSRHQMFWWQLFATVRWGVMCLEQARTHLSGEMRSVELAVIGRRAAEVEYDVVRLLEAR